MTHHYLLFFVFCFLFFSSLFSKQYKRLIGVKKKKRKIESSSKEEEEDDESSPTTKRYRFQYTNPPVNPKALYNVSVDEEEEKCVISQKWKDIYKNMSLTELKQESHRLGIKSGIVKIDALLRRLEGHESQNMYMLWSRKQKQDELTRLGLDSVGSRKHILADRLEEHYPFEDHIRNKEGAVRLKEVEEMPRSSREIVNYREMPITN